jgi:Xaa-Pro aminopeptidase
MRFAGRGARTRKPASEHDVVVWIRKAFDRAGLVTESGPSVSFGANSARNHYEPTAETAAKIVLGEMLLVDLWAKEPGGIYADQTWMASVGAPNERDGRVWETVRKARDAALELLRTRVESGVPVQGAEVDRAARSVTEAAGFRHAIASRTGHSIDRFGLHGFGPTIDDTETCDNRLLIPGVGFSVEPGVYLAGECGARSEVNALVLAREVLVTPANYQTEITVL